MSGSNDTIDRHATFSRLPKPLMLSGKVVRGLGRGSKDLGCPTASIELDRNSMPTFQKTKPGVYFGHAFFAWQSTIPYAMVMNVGSLSGEEENHIDVHLLHEFPKHFFGKTVGTMVLRYLRPHVAFVSLDAHKLAIQEDIKFVKLHLESGHLETKGWSKEENGLCQVCTDND